MVPISAVNHLGPPDQSSLCGARPAQEGGDTCRNGALDDAVKFTNGLGSRGPHPDHEVLILIEWSRDSTAAADGWKIIVVLCQLVSVQVVPVIMPCDVRFLPPTTIRCTSLTRAAVAQCGKFVRHWTPQDPRASGPIHSNSEY